MTARGNERQAIVRDDLDRGEWVATLDRVVMRFGWLIYAYCLLDNHFHLLVETPRPNLARGMRQLNGVYAQDFNRRHGRVGHLFSGRYKAILVDRDRHLLEVCRYIVLNPVRAKVARNTHEATRWSSYRATAGLAPAPRFLRPDKVLGLFDGELEDARLRYRRFVRDGLRARQAHEEAVGGIYLGDKPFVRNRRRASLPTSAEIPRRQREPIRCSLETLLEQELDGAITRSYVEHGYRLREIADVLGLHYSTVSRRLKREAERANT